MLQKSPVALLCAALFVSPAAFAQAWPAKPVRVIVSFPPGGGLDFFTRIAVAKMQENMGSQFVIENRSGASGSVGAEAVAKAPPDGYTVLFSSSAEITINQHLYPKLGYDAVRDLAPSSYAAHAPLLFSVHPSLPVRSVKELVALARSRPGQLNYASAGTGGVQHLAGELLKSSAKIDIVHVPYKGAGPAVVDMVGGHVSMGFTALPSSLPQARAGKLRPMATTSVKRSEAAPDLPTFTELGFPEIDLVVWYGVLFPAKTSPDIVSRMSSEVSRAVQAQDVKQRLIQQGVESVGTTPEEFAKFIRSETSRYGKIIKASGAKPD